MKKITIVTISSFIFLLFCSLVTFLLKFSSIESKWLYLIIGVVLLLISGIIAILIRKKSFYGNIICLLINSIALGFCIKAWYVYRNIDNPLWIMILVSVAAVLYLLVFYFLLYIPLFNKHFKIYLWSYFILSLIIYLVIVFTTKTSFVSTFGYYMIIEAAFILALCDSSNSYLELFRNITLSSYSVFIVAIIIALLMLEADFDFDVGNAKIGNESPKSPIRKKVNRIDEDNFFSDF